MFLGLKGASIESILKNYVVLLETMERSTLPPLISIPVELEVRCQSWERSTFFGLK